ncbi:HD-GYP domain-containing protein [Sporomusa aerivorans]|uniref:HD-GYP domain-containing protein n=1 Tax=Sporomusa aerivorans TaxID=204936 RepID=UPI00352AA7A4
MVYSKSYSVKDIVPGMTISKPVLGNKGRVLLGEGIILSERIIDQLVNWGIQQIDIQEINQTVAAHVEDLMECVRQTKENYEGTLDSLKTYFEQTRRYKKLSVQSLRDLADNSILQLVNTSGIISYLLMLERKDDYTFHHSLNVSILAGVLGKWLGITSQELNDLILAGLMHDAGKALVDINILNKPEKLSGKETEIMQYHPVFGYELLKDSKELPETVRLGVLQHHERMDGSGYPLKLSGGQIHYFGKVIAIVDIYDAMTSDRVYKTKADPFSVIETLASEMFGKIDAEFCSVFLQNISNYLTGKFLRLTDGRVAEVVYYDNVSYSRPVIRTGDNEFIDLNKNKVIGISEVIDV